MALRRFKHRTKTDARDEVTAAALIDLADPGDFKYLRSTASLSKQGSEKAWKWYDGIGEVHYAVGRSAKIAGYAKLGAYKLNPDGSIGDKVESGLAADIAAGLYSPYGGVRGLISRFYTLMKIPGDCYLVRCRDEDGDADGWQFLSSAELDTSTMRERDTGRTNSVRWVTLPGRHGDEQFVIDVAPEDFIGRVWIPSPQFVDMPDSPMHGLETECEVLYALTETLKAKIYSRFALAGILYLPKEISDINTSWKPPEAGQYHQDRVLNWLVSAMMQNVQRHDDASAYVPIVLRGPGEAADMIRHITVDREIFEVDIRLRSELIGRILMGLDVQQDAVAGVGDTNHWAAWAVSDEERRISVQPDLEMMCWAVTRMVLHREMMAAGASPEEIMSTVIWYDLSAAAVRSNQQEDGRQLADRGALSPAALRRIGNFKESDAPSEDEYIRWVGLQTKNAYLALWGVEADIDWEKATPSKTGPAPDSPADEPGSGPGVGDPGSPDDIDSDTPRSQRPD